MSWIARWTFEDFFGKFVSLLVTSHIDEKMHVIDAVDNAGTVAIGDGAEDVAGALYVVFAAHHHAEIGFVDGLFLKGLDGLSIALDTKIALSDGFPSLFKNPPGIFPTAYNFSS